MLPCPYAVIAAKGNKQNLQPINAGYAAARLKRCHLKSSLTFLVPMHAHALPSCRSSLFSNRVKVVSNILVHPEHVHPGLLEDCLHLFVAYNLAFVLGILKIVCFDVFPELLDNLRSGQLWHPC
jgi:hypothetical protein